MIHEKYLLLIGGILFSVFIFCSNAVSDCLERRNNNDWYLFDLDTIDLINGGVNVCPLTSWQVRPSDIQAQSGGGFFATRGTYLHCHFGVDLEKFSTIPKHAYWGVGEPVYAVGNGNVVVSQEKWAANGMDNIGFGTTVIINHGRNLYSLYGHLNSRGVQKGDNVNEGQVIGTIGYTGNANQFPLYNLPAHLHFSLFRLKESLGSFPLTLSREVEVLNNSIDHLNYFGFYNPEIWLRGCTQPKKILYNSVEKPQTFNKLNLTN